VVELCLRVRCSLQLRRWQRIHSSWFGVTWTGHPLSGRAVGDAFRRFGVGYGDLVGSSCWKTCCADFLQRQPLD